MASNVELHNPSTEGVGGLKGIRLPDGFTPITGVGEASFKKAVNTRMANTPAIQDIGYVGVNDSRLDKGISSLEDFYNLEEFRGQVQSEVGQIVNGVIKGAVLAGTTFLDGTVGLITGIAQGISNMADKDDTTGFWQGLWQNEFSQLMNDTNKAVENIFKNYYTKDELENPLAARNIFSGNFIGDKFLKNIGFTIGAYYSGKAFTSILQATKLPTLLGVATKSARVPNMVTSGSGAVVSALNEGRIMALEDSNNWRTLQEQQAKDRFTQNLMSINQYEGTAYYAHKEQEFKNQYLAELDKIQEDQAKMGNMEMFLNIPLLTASNLFQFGKLYSNGFKSQRILSKLSKRNALQTGMKALGNGLSEGFEEVSQGAISNIAGLGYEQDVMNFYASKRDANSEKKAIDWMKAISTGLNDTFNDSATAEEFLIGTLTGFLGMPVFGKANTKNAWLGKDKMIGLAGGIGGEIQESKEYNERVDRIANYINSRTAEDKETLNYYRGLIRHIKTQDDMDKAASIGSTKDFKNAEFEQLLSDIMMFDNAGKIEDFMAIIDAAYDTSDENLNAIIENTTTTLEDGTKKGPFIDSSGNKLTATPEGKENMIKQINQAKEAMVNTINNYIKVKNDIDVRTGEALEDDELETLVSLRMKVDNWKNRIKEVHSGVKDKLAKLAVDYHKFAYEIAGSAEKVDPNLKEFSDALFNTANKSAEEIATMLMLDPKYIDKLYQSVLPLVESGKSSIDLSELDTLLEELKDIRDLSMASTKFTAKFNEYTRHPENLKKDLEDTYAKLEKSYNDSQIEDYAEEILKGATDVNSLKEVLQNIPSNKLQLAFTKALEKASEEQKKIFQDFDDLDTIVNSLQSFDVHSYSSGTAAILASNIESILANATSKDDVLEALNILKESLANTGNTEASKAVEDFINHIHATFTELEKAANPPTAEPETTSTASTGGTGLLGGMTPTATVTEKDTIPPGSALPVSGATREEALQNAIDKLDELFNNGTTELIEDIVNRGLYNPNLTEEDVQFIKETAREYLNDQITSTPEEVVRTIVENKIAQQEVNYKRDKTLASTVVTDYSIHDAKNKKKVAYIPTEADLAKIQSFLKAQGTYTLMESGKIGVLNAKVRNGIDINFITNEEYPNTIFLATEVTSEFKRRVNTSFSPIVINGKEYAVLGVLNNNSSEDYSNIVDTVKAETEGQTSSWKIAKSVTKIKQFYSGRMVTSDESNPSEERPLSTLLTGKTLGKDYGFAIVYGDGNDKYIGIDEASEEIAYWNQYLPADKRNGSLWIMARGSNGVWYPHYVSIARTGEIEWSDNTFFDSIRKYLKELVSNGTLEDKLKAKLALNKTIFFPSGNKLSFTDDFVSIGGTKIKKVDYANNSDYINAIINTIKSKNLRFQVSARALDNSTTRNDIIEAGIIKSDLLQLEHIIGSFDVYGLTETPAGTSTQHTGNRKVIPTNRVDTFYVGGKQYDEFINERGEVEFYTQDGNKVTTHPLYEQLKALSDIAKKAISGVIIGDATYYKIPYGSKFLYIEHRKSQAPKFINGRVYNSKINKTKKTNAPLPTSGLLSTMTTGVATPESEVMASPTQNTEGTSLLGAMQTGPAVPEPNEFDFNRMMEIDPPFDIPAPEVEMPMPEAEQPTVEQPVASPTPEAKPKPKVSSRKDSLRRIKQKATTSSDIDGWIEAEKSNILDIAQDVGFEGSLSEDSIKGLLEKNGIPLDSIKDSEDLKLKLDYILNCKQ